jgi:hypothetical protein
VPDRLARPGVRAGPLTRDGALAVRGVLSGRGRAQRAPRGRTGGHPTGRGRLRGPRRPPHWIGHGPARPCGLPDRDGSFCSA